MSGPRFGGRQATGTPSLALSSVVVVVSLLTGASIVHNIFKPDLVLASTLCYRIFRLRAFDSTKS